MSAQSIGSVVLWIVILVAAIAIVVYFVNWLYRRSSKEVSFVRTGLGGERVVIDGGAFVLPFIHDVTPVNMNVLQMAVARTKENAVITRDRMRVDIAAEFYVRVQPSREAVSVAAATLGRRTMDPPQLHALLAGKFVSALRSIASEMTMDEMHEHRGDYVARVRTAAAEPLRQNGLELESVAITELDQTDLSYFNPSNRFDAEGLTKLIEVIEARRKLRNDIEQDSMIRIRARNLEAEKQALDIDRDSEAARLDQQRDVEIRRASQRADVARERALHETEAEQAQTSAQQAIELMRIAQQKSVSEARIASERDIRQREIERTVAIDESEIAGREAIERARIAQETLIAAQRIAAGQQTSEHEIARNRALDEATLRAREAVETARVALDERVRGLEIARDNVLQVAEIARDQTLETARLERRRALEQLEVSRAQALQEAEIGAREDVERTRLASERGLDEARVARERDLRKLEIERERDVETAAMEKAIALFAKSLEHSAAQIESELARARAAEAEEQVQSVHEHEAAKRRRTVEILLAEKDADEVRIAAEAAAIRAVVEAEAQKLLYEAENVLTDEARQGLFRRRLLDRVEGIIRESVKPMEKIEAIRILQVDGLGGGAGHGGGSRNPTDEVIDSALRYRIQAPMVDQILKEIGIEGGSIARMGNLIREASDVQRIAKDAAPKPAAKPSDQPGPG